MATKLNKKLLLVSLLGVLGLTACNEVISYPNDGKGDILPPTPTREIYNNDLESIYEKIREGSLASDVLDKLLYEFANTIFGRFSASSPSYSSLDKTAKTLSQVAAGTDQEKLDFISTHKAYWPGEEAPSTAEEKALAIAKLDAIYASIEDRIATSLYNKISGGTYSEHNIFSEKKFLASLYFDGKKVAKYNEVNGVLYEGIIDPEVKAEDVFEAGILHKEYYYSDVHTYAVTENIESIYKELLTEQYIIDESYSTLGRSYARKVNVLSITTDSNNKADVPALVDYVLNNFITKKDGDNLRFAAHPEESVKGLFSSVSNIMRGLPKYFNAGDTEYDATAKAIVDALYTNFGLYGDTTTLADGGYLTSTEYGSLMKDYAKIKDDLKLTDSSIESSFTGSGAYTVEKGKQYKETEIELKKYTNDGWYIKNGGLTSLPDSIRNRLFNISVANALDKTSDGLVDRLEVEGGWNAAAYDAESKISKHVAKVNGAYFLKRETVEDKASNKDLYFYESSSSTYYFVQIVEAVNPAKLSQGDNSYTKIASAAKQETIARDVCEVVGKISSYSTLAKEHWLEKMLLEYHDTVVYDYFKSNYPDLFE